MLKVIIVDDENRVCQLIKILVDWQKLDMEVVAEIDNGIEALNVIKRIKPDIVIADIRMPGIDGIELVKKTKEQNIPSIFIIISGYASFEYAQSAIKYGVIDYLLKPINGDELEKILNKISENKIKQMEQNQIIYEFKNKYITSRNKLRLQLIQAFYSKANKPNIENINNINNEYQYRFRKGSFQVFIFKLDILNFLEKNYECGVLEIIKEKALATFKDYCYDLEFYVNNYYFTGIINYDSNNNSIIKKKLKLLFSEIKNYLQKFNDINITLGIGDPYNETNRIFESFYEAYAFISARIFTGIGRVIEKSDYIECRKIKLNKILTIQKEKQFASFLEGFNIDKINEYIEEIFKLNINRLRTDPGLIMEIVNKLLDVIVNIMTQLEFDFNEKADLDVLLIDIENAVTINQIIRKLKNFIYEISIEYQSFQNNKNSKPIILAKQYISEHFKEDIKLADISNIVYLNPVYFSTIFKKQCGINFSEYLINYRIEMAKALLKDHKNNISEVANMVGYSDSNYFNKIFKKITGINPSHYRKLYN